MSIEHCLALYNQLTIKEVKEIALTKEEHLLKNDLVVIMRKWIELGDLALEDHLNDKKRVRE